MRSSRHPQWARRWALYTTLLLLRLVGVLQRGYVHPDEFYQGGSELFFGRGDRASTSQGGDDRVANHVPWEFEPVHAVRSIVPPAAVTLLPLRVYVAVRRRTGGFASRAAESNPHEEEIDIAAPKSFLKSSVLWTPAMESLSGREILLVPRVFLALISVIFLDGSLWMLLWLDRRSGRNPRRSDGRRGGPSAAARSCPPVEVIVLASSWPCLVFGVRPFTNSLEAMALAFLLVVVAMQSKVTTDAPQNNLLGGKALPAGDVPSLLLIGAICSVGVFARFTFAFYAFPVMIIFLWHRWDNVGFKLRFIVRDGFWMAFSFLATSCVFIWADTKYYSCQTQLNGDGVTFGERPETTVGSMLKYVAPFNAFRYNSKSANLAEHGLHPRITHAAVNMPMLFGPLAFVGFGSMVESMHGMINGRSKEHRDDSSNSFTKSICQWTIIVGLLVLSCAPHQEPRFLLPIIVPLVFLHGRKIVGDAEAGGGANSDAYQQNKSNVALPTLWVTSNLILYLFFGWLHQGGLIPSLLHLPFWENVLPRNESATQPPRAFIYYKTYMPPSFLTLGARNDGVCVAPDRTCADVLQPETYLILDLKGADSSVLLGVLRKWLPCHSDDTGDGDTRGAKPSESASDGFVHLVSPPTVMLPLMGKNVESTAKMAWEQYSIRLVREHPGHISTEDWPVFDGSLTTFVGQLKLDLYTVSCMERKI